MLFRRWFFCAVVCGCGLPLVAHAQTRTGLDPCALISQASLAGALSVTADQIGTPTHPTAEECAWAVASHAGSGAQRVLLGVETARAAKSCRGLSCVFMAQSVLSLANISAFSPGIMEALSDAQIIAGLGDKAGWKNGALTVLKNEIAFRLVVSGAGSDARRLAISEALARDVLTRL